MINSRAKFYGFLAVFMAVGATFLAVANRVINRILRKSSLPILIILLLSGCATMTYTQDKNGNTTVKYTRFLTSSDEISGKVGDAKVSVTGQKAVDAEVIKAVIATAITAATK